MLFRPVVSSLNDTIEGYEQQAANFYDDGFSLLTANSVTGVYLLGYVAEMLLKSAYFRLGGVSPSAPVPFGQINQSAAQFSVTTPQEAYHSILFWHDMVVAKRRAVGKVDVALEAALAQQARVLHENWIIQMRYRPVSGATYQDFNAVFEAASWLVKHHEDLWK